MSNFNKSDLPAAVALIRESFGPVATPAMGVLLQKHFPYLHAGWEKEKAELDKSANAALLAWKASCLKQEVNRSFARGDKS